MKKIKKISYLLVALMLLASTLMGCTQEKDDLYKAYFGEYNSGKMNMKMSVKFNQPLPKEWDPAGQIAAIVNKTNVDVNALYDTNNKDAVKMSMKMDVNGLDEVVGMPIKDINAWMDFKIADKNMTGKLIYQFPAEITALMGLPTDAQYLYMDFAEVFAGQPMPAEMFEFTPEQSQEMTKEIFKAMGTQDIKPVLKDGVYTITLTEEQVKKAVVGMMEYSLKLQQPMLDEMKKEFTPEEKVAFDAEMNKGINQVKDTFNKMDIFADDAVVIKITLDENKLIKTMDVTTNIKADVAKIETALMGAMTPEATEEAIAEEVAPVVPATKVVPAVSAEKAVPTVPATKVVPAIPAQAKVIDMSINLNYTYSDTNKPVEIVFPTLTKENAIDMMGMADMGTAEAVEVIPAVPVEKAPAIKEAPAKK